MKSISFAFMLCFVIAVAEAVPAPDEFDQKIEETFFSANARHSDTSWITDENRQSVIENLQRRASDQYEGPYVREALVRAGHWDTILGVIEDMKNPRKGTDLLRYLNQEMIPYVMPLVYTGSTANPNSPGADVIRMPVRKTASQMVLGTIWKCEGFPPKTRKWAEDMGNNNRANGYKDEAWVALITSWWEHNQTAVLEKHYKDATWLPTYKGVPVNRTPDEMRMIVDHLEKDNATRLAKRTGPGGATGILPRSTTPRPGETAGENTEEQPAMLLWVGIGAIVTAVGGFLWRKFAARNAA